MLCTCAVVIAEMWCLHSVVVADVGVVVICKRRDLAKVYRAGNASMIWQRPVASVIRNGAGTKPSAPSSRLIRFSTSGGQSFWHTRRISAERGSLYRAKALFRDFVSISVCKDTPYFLYGRFYALILLLVNCGKASEGVSFDVKCSLKPTYLPINLRYWPSCIKFACICRPQECLAILKC